MDEEIERNLQTLSKRESKASQKYFAGLILLELLQKSPSLASNYAIDIIDKLYPLLPERQLETRQLATELLKECLRLLQGKPAHMEGKMSEIFTNLKLVIELHFCFLIVCID